MEDLPFFSVWLNETCDIKFKDLKKILFQIIFVVNEHHNAGVTFENLFPETIMIDVNDFHCYFMNKLGERYFHKKISSQTTFFTKIFFTNIFTKIFFTNNIFTKNIFPVLLTNDLKQQNEVTVCRMIVESLDRCIDRPSWTTHLTSEIDENHVSLNMLKFHPLFWDLEKSLSFIDNIGPLCLEDINVFQGMSVGETRKMEKFSFLQDKSIEEVLHFIWDRENTVY